MQKDSKGGQYARFFVGAGTVLLLFILMWYLNIKFYDLNTKIDRIEKLLNEINNQ